MNLLLISGDGIGAGKTTLARRMVGQSNVIGLAGALRDELFQLYPNTSWWDKSQEGKNKLVQGKGQYEGMTVRASLIHHGQHQCTTLGLDYWAQRLKESIIDMRENESEQTILAIDDVRKVVELEVLRNIPHVETTHIHVRWAGAIYEPEFENAELSLRADYIIHRNA